MIADEQLRFDGKVAIVTGGAQGLGEQYVRLLASRGASVVVNDLGQSLSGEGESDRLADRLVSDLEKHGCVAVSNSDDVADPRGAQNIVQTALNHFGTVDLLITNAGILRDKSFHKIDLNNFSAVLNVHLMGTVNVARFAYPVMREKGFGRILTVTSTSGLFGNFGQTSYAAAKMGIVGFMKSLAVEGRSRDVHVNALSPGATTRMTAGVTGSMFDRLGAEQTSATYPAALAACLLHESCMETGKVFAAVGRYFSTDVVAEGEGIVAQPGDVISPEWLIEQWDKIRCTSRLTQYCDAGEHMEQLSARLVADIATRE